MNFEFKVDLDTLDNVIQKLEYIKEEIEIIEAKTKIKEQPKFKFEDQVAFTFGSSNPKQYDGEILCRDPRHSDIWHIRVYREDPGIEGRFYAGAMVGEEYIKLRQSEMNNKEKEEMDRKIGNNFTANLLEAIDKKDSGKLNQKEVDNILANTMKNFIEDRRKPQNENKN